MTVRRVVLAGVAVLLPALAAAVSSLSASAADRSSSVSCSTGSSCEIMLEHMIHFGGKNYSPGAENTVVDITPPPCLWIPEGDGHAGSQYVIDFYNGTDPGPGALFDGEHAFQEAKQLVNQNPTPPGTWYELPVQLSTNDNSARLDTGGCGYLGSTEMVRNPRAVAHTGANGTADCGVTFRQPGTWNITATLTWRACWAVGVQDGPPPAGCNPVPGAALNAVN